jgi:hypothetical protein
MPAMTTWRRPSALDRARQLASSAQDGLGKALGVGQRQADDLALFDGALGGLLHGGYHEVGQGAALHLRGTLEHGVQLGADAGFEPSGGSG